MQLQLWSVFLVQWFSMDGLALGAQAGETKIDVVKVEGFKQFKESYPDAIQHCLRSKTMDR